MHDVDSVMRAGVRALALFLLLAGCGSSTTTSVTAPASSGARCQPSLQGSQTSFGSSGGTGTVTIGVERECAWTAGTLASWVEITSSRQGQGDATLSYRVQANPDPVVRRGGLTVGEQRLDLTQDAAPCQFGVSHPTDSIGADGGQARVNVSAHSACRWTASSDAPWVVVSPASGAGSAAVQMSVQANPGGARTATLTVAGQQLPLTQVAKGSPPSPPPAPAPSPTPPPAPGPPPAPAPGCSFRLEPSQREFTAVGGAGSFTVETGAACAWTASSNEAWVVLSGSTNGIGPQEVRYLVLPNLARENRDARVTVAGSTHRVTQRGLDGEEAKVSGDASGVSGTCPNLRFTVRSTTVITSSSTEFRKGPCSDITAGREVAVEGTRLGDGTIAADKVELKK
jgi:hypothetical protein